MRKSVDKVAVNVAVKMPLTQNYGNFNIML